MKITGIGITRNVYVNDTLITTEGGIGVVFDWGKDGNTTTLARCLLSEQGCTEEEIKKYAEGLSLHLLKKLPLTNFSLDFDFEAWLLDAEANTLKVLDNYIIDNNLPIFSEIPVYEGRRIS